MTKHIFLLLGFTFFAEDVAGQIFTKLTGSEVATTPGDSYGAAWGDYDGDRDLDLFVATFGGSNKLYRNDGLGEFTEVASALGLSSGVGRSLGVSWADYDNDGDLDLFVCQERFDDNILFRNDGNRFTNVSEILGTTDLDKSYSVAWGDYDGDGYLDLFIANFGGENRLYRNERNAFTNVAPSVGMTEIGHSRAASWCDYDNDGDLDLYVCQGVSTQDQPDLLYRNDGGYFENIANASGITDTLYSLGADWGDYDNDGDFDLFVTTRDGQPNKLYRNDNGVFRDISAQKEVDNSDGSSLSVAWVDYDNDGDLDLFVTRSEGFGNLLYENDNGNFIEVANALGEDTGRSIGLSWGDMNQDGFVDVFIPNRFGKDALYVNNGNQNKWIVIEAIGTESNVSAIGSRIEVIAGNIKQIKQVSGGSGEASQNSLPVEFGLGEASVIDSIKVKWPNGIFQILTNVNVNQFLTIVENSISKIHLEIATLNAFPGDTLQVPVNVRFPADSVFSSAQIEIGGYLGQLTFIEVVTDSSLAGDAAWTVQANENDSLNTIWAAGAEGVTGQGVLFRLKFAIPEVASGFVPITIESAIFDTGDLAVAGTSGGVTVFPSLFGDVDLNGQIQAFDAALILKHLVGSVSLDIFQLANANVSSDTTVSALDATLILQYGVGIIDTLPYDSTMGSVSAIGDIVMEDQQIQAGEIVNIPLFLRDASNILSFEGKVSVNPAHLDYADIVWSELPNGFSVETRSSQNGEILFSGAGSVPADDAGILVIMQLRVKENFSADETTVTLTRLQWNEEAVLQNVATATLSRLVVGVGEEKAGVPMNYSLGQNYPNPFNPETVIRYELQETSQVELVIYNILGEEIRTLINQRQDAGPHQKRWDGTNDTGLQAPSGIYLYRLRTGNFIQTKRMVLLR